MSYGWTAEADAWLRRKMAQSPPRKTAVWWNLLAAEWNAGKALRDQRTGKAFGIRWSHLKGTAPSAVRSTGEPAVPPVPQGQANGDTPALHVKKLHVHVPTDIAPASTNGMLTAVLYGDTHYPFQDDDALRVVAQVIRVAQPDVVVHMGDLLDCYHLSRFDKNPKRIHGLQSEIDQARAHLAAMRLLAPKARFIWLEGNHEDRLRRTMWSMPPHAEALMALDAVQGALTWPKLMGLDDLDIEFYEYATQSRQRILPKWILKHGSVVRKVAGYTARAEHERYGKSGSSGHTHRLADIMRSDHNGAHCWLETGCTCHLQPEYTADPDWAQGCFVVTFEPTTGAFGTEKVYIKDGTAIIRGRFYDCKESA